jgi:hypothetical protein
MYLILLFISIYNYNPFISGQELGPQRESVNAGKIYDFFTNDVVAQKFFASIILQVNVYYNLFVA